jgi:vacuolar-type H+-ATPase subunit H
MAAAAGAASENGLDALRRIKAAETEWDQRLATVRQATETSLQRLRDETDAAVKAAQAEADQERAQTVQAARADADREAARILADGAQAAAEAARGEGKHPADRKDAVLAAVLGDFAPG